FPTSTSLSPFYLR
nr:Chain B, a-crystallin B [Homo sapiens]5VVV_D Chain D, a-crystallin B [Homo sapiens]